MLYTEDLARAATGCRALAYRYTCAAHLQKDPETRAGLEHEARELLAIAERFDRARETRTLAPAT